MTTKRPEFGPMFYHRNYHRGINSRYYENLWPSWGKFFSRLGRSIAWLIHPEIHKAWCRAYNLGGIFELWLVIGFLYCFPSVSSLAEWSEWAAWTNVDHPPFRQITAYHRLNPVTIRGDREGPNTKLISPFLPRYPQNSPLGVQEQFWVELFVSPHKLYFLETILKLTCISF